MAKKKEDVKTNVVRLLEEARIPHRTFVLPLEKDQVPDGITAAKLMGQPVEKVFKTLVAEGPRGEHFVFVIPVAETLDLKKAAKAAGVKSVSMLPQKKLLPLTGYVHGGCSPVGMSRQFPTWFAEEVILVDTMVCSAGKVGHQIEVKPEDLMGMINGETADLIVR